MRRVKQVFYFDPANFISGGFFMKNCHTTKNESGNKESAIVNFLKEKRKAGKFNINKETNHVQASQDQTRS